jgi:fluoride exporter
MTYYTALAIAIGGGLGAVTRAYISMLSEPASASLYSISLGTLWVNYLGSFGLALAIQVLPLNSILRVAICTGFMGGLTTFSTLSYENFEQLQVSGIMGALFHLTVHYVGGLICIALGLWVGSLMIAK